MVLLTIFILVAGANAGKLGLDYWIVPTLKNIGKKNFGPTRDKTRAI